MIFVKYVFIGLLNTVIHWIVFYWLYILNVKQYLGNFIGFCCAVIFSYIMNAKYNFQSKQSLKKFSLFFCLMSTLNLGMGGLADYLNLLPFFTLVVSSGLSFFVGYIVSKYFVFKVIK
ncbi:MAG: GtrA family protein [Acinetobacter junii]|uniref:GtrA family protein n=1 Tax=Acinetobacter indicus TaxID=756892 RepID=UPI000CEBDB6F|nr:GtrA family protein [Acinetobacter indicus]MDU2406859.1 GtrA family protein [Acinetobacter junii]